MSTSSPDVYPVSKQSYDRRKNFVETLKTLEKNDYEELFRLLKKANVEFSENSNGIFFDVTNLCEETFILFEEFMVRLKKQKDAETQRVQELNALRGSKDL